MPVLVVVGRARAERARCCHQKAKPKGRIEQVFGRVPAHERCTALSPPGADRFAEGVRAPAEMSSP